MSISHKVKKKGVYLMVVALLLNSLLGAFTSYADTQVTMTIEKTHNNISGGRNGTITVVPSNGSGAYEFSKDGGQTWQTYETFFNLASGSYLVVSRDKNNTSNTSFAQNIIIEGPKTISFSVTAKNTSFPDARDGSVTLTATGGSGEYEYSLSHLSMMPVSWTTNNVFTGLGPRTYYVYIRDKNNHSSFRDRSVRITETPFPKTTTYNDGYLYLGISPYCNGTISEKFDDLWDEHGFTFKSTDIKTFINCRDHYRKIEDTYYIRDNMPNLESFINYDCIYRSLPDNAFHNPFTHKGHANLREFRYKFINFGDGIGNYAFNACPKLEIVEMPNVNTIGIYAFAYSPLLDNISFPHLKVVSTGAFQGCTGLTSVKLPNVTEIKDHGFYLASGLKNINFLRASTIRFRAFQDCSSLEEIVLRSATLFEDWAFYRCSNLRKMHLGSQPPSVGFGTFNECPSDRVIIVPQNAIDTYKAINDGNVNDNYWYGWRITSASPELQGGLNFIDDDNNGTNTMAVLGAPSSVSNHFVYKLYDNLGLVERPLMNDKLSTWPSISNGQSIAVNAGNYIGVAEVDGHGQVIQFSYKPVVFSKEPVETTIEKTVASQSIKSDGSISIFANGGSGTYIYSIDGGLSWFKESNFTSLKVGVYHVLAADRNDHNNRTGIMSVTVDALNTPPSVVSGKETQVGTAVPASADNSIIPVVYTTDLSTYFNDIDKDVLTYKLISALDDTIDIPSHITIDGSTLTYTPRAAQASKEVRITVAANDGDEDSSNNVTFIINVDHEPIVDAETPVIINDLSDYLVMGGSSLTLDATASISDGGSLSYQWYEADDKSKTNGRRLVETQSNYVISTTSAGTSFYYCVVTNTNNSVNGQQSVDIESAVAQITFTETAPLIDAETPVIINTLTDHSVYVGESVTLDATASISDGGSLSYQWYEADDKSKTNARRLVETQSNYVVSTTSAGTSFYYCVVTNRNNSVNGQQSVDIESGVAQITFTETVPLIDAEKPVFVNNLKDVKARLGDQILLDAATTVTDGGQLTYTWYKVSDKNKSNPQILNSTEAQYRVDTNNEGTYYYYCKVTNTKLGLSGQNMTSVESYVAEISIRGIVPNTSSMVHYDPVVMVQTGDVVHDNVQYKTSNSVIAALPSDLQVELEDGRMVMIPIIWQDKDGYNAKLAGAYTFVATWESFSKNVDNDENLEAPQVILKVEQGTMFSAGTSGNSKKKKNDEETNTNVIKTATEKAYETIEKIKPNTEGIVKLSAVSRTKDNGKSSFKLPSNFLNNKTPMEISIESKNLQVILNNKMFSQKDKQVELVMEPTDKKALGLLEDEIRQMGNAPVYNIYLKINGEKMDWSGQEDIAITIQVESIKDIEKHKFVAVYYDRKGNIEIIKSSYLQNGKLHFKTKHLSDYGLLYIESSFKDIDNHWAKEAIEALSAREVVKGISGEVFAPDATITRADLVTLIIRYFDFGHLQISEINNDTVAAFKDVKSDAYYEQAVAKARKIGLVNGCGNDEFKPLSPVRRQDMMVLLDRAIELSKDYPNLYYKEDRYSHFIDGNKTASYAVENVMKMVNCDLVKTGINVLEPQKEASRAEVVYALYNLMKTNRIEE